MHFRIRLFHGILKIKTESYLRTSERDGEVPVWRLGEIYFIWVRDVAPASEAAVPTRATSAVDSR